MTSKPVGAPSYLTLPIFPSSSSPRVWVITSASSPLAIAVARAVLDHGDSAVLGLTKPIDGVDVPGSLKQGGVGRDASALLAGEEKRDSVFRRFWAGMRETSAKDRCRAVVLDGRIIGQCQAAVAEAVSWFGRIDVLLCCSSEALVGTIEELSVSPEAESLVHEHMETNFFGPINCIKAHLPTMRKQNSGHIMVVTGITGHLGTPGLGMNCASSWGLEGFCDSLAYEVAPHNIKMTILQPTLEINTLTNKINAAPAMQHYAPEKHPAPLSRSIIGGLVDRIERENGDQISSIRFSSPKKDGIASMYPSLPDQMRAQLLAETVHAITSIGGHENPPARHIVGFEGVASVKEKLKAGSEELEDFVEVSCGVDIDEDDDEDVESALDEQADSAAQ